MKKGHFSMRICAFFLLSLCSIGLTGCYPDPYQNPVDWSLRGATRENIAVQAANPSDLIVGKSAPGSNGVTASAAIDKALGGTAGTASGLQTAPPQTSIDVSGS